MGWSELLVRDWALSPARMTFAHCSTYFLFYGFRVEQKSPAIFTGVLDNFLSEIGLFRQPGGTVHIALLIFYSVVSGLSRNLRPFSRAFWITSCQRLGSFGSQEDICLFFYFFYSMISGLSRNLRPFSRAVVRTSCQRLGSFVS
jgi:hypothetical protein